MSKLQINTVLHTKNGEMVGNAIIVDYYEETKYYKVKTDYGNVLYLQERDINVMFNIADSFVQEWAGINHKYAVKKQSLKDLLSTPLDKVQNVYIRRSATIIISPIIFCIGLIFGPYLVIEWFKDCW